MGFLYSFIRNSGLIQMALISLVLPKTLLYNFNINQNLFKKGIILMMKNVYEINYRKLCIEDKISFVGSFSKIAENSFEEESLEITWLAQLLIFSRSWNSYQYMDEPNMIPKVIPLAINLLWDYLDGKITIDELERFQEGFFAGILLLNTGDDSKINETEDVSQFFEKYFNGFNDFYIVFAESIAVLLKQVVRNEMSWYPVENLLYGDIGDDKIEFFEDIPENKASTVEQNKVCDSYTYRSKTFCSVIDFIQNDMREALQAQAISELREKYKEKFLFDIELCKKILGGKGFIEKGNRISNFVEEISKEEDESPCFGGNIAYERLSNPKKFPQYLVTKDFDGMIQTMAVGLENLTDIVDQVQLFLSSKLSSLRMEWKMSETSGETGYEPYSIYLLLLNDGENYLMVYLNDKHKTLRHLVFDSNLYMSTRKVKLIPFTGIKHKSYLIHRDISKIAEKLMLMPPHRLEEDGDLKVYLEFSSCKEMKKGKQILNYDEIKSIYFEM